MLQGMRGSGGGLLQESVSITMQKHRALGTQHLPPNVKHDKVLGMAAQHSASMTVSGAPCGAWS